MSFGQWIRSAPRAVYRSIRDVLRYVSELPELGSTIFIGGLLWGYGIWLILPSFLVMGYLLHILRHVPSTADDPDITPVPNRPPRWDDWLSLLIDGGRAYIIWSIYLFFAFASSVSLAGPERSGELFVMVVGMIFANFSLLINVRNAIGDGAIERSTFAVGDLYDPAILLFLFSLYIAPAALLNVAARGRLADGIDLQAIRPILRSPAYARRWSVFIILWFVGTAVLLVSPDWVASQFVNPDSRALFEGIREGYESVRGFVSFALLLIGYTVLGKVAVPPIDRFSLWSSFEGIFGRHLVSMSRTGAGLGQIVIVGGLLTSFMSLPTFVLFNGYLVKFIRAVDEDEPLPTFDGIWQTVVDGVRAVILWVLYALMPLLSLKAWWTAVRFDDDVLTALTGVPGAIIGRWYAGRDLFIAIDDRSVLIDIFLGVDPSLLAATFIGSLFLSLYLFPLALINVARTGQLLTGVSPRALVADASRLTYIVGWLQAMSYLLLAGALGFTWNWWRLSQSGVEIETLARFGPFNLLTVPTELGLTSSFFLFVVSSVGVFLTLRAYHNILHSMQKEHF